ncbi:MAG: chemotaxis protein CheB [Gemmatimonadaceae bacterium]
MTVFVDGRVRVLVVHRSAVTREVLRVRLGTLERTQVQASPTAQVAQSRVRRELPDVVVLPLHDRDEGMEQLAFALERAGVPTVDADAVDLLARVRRLTRVAGRRAAAPVAPAAPRRPDGPPRVAATLIALGASTGGTEALRSILTGMPAEAPPIVAVQHMPPGYTRAFAERLGCLSRIEVREARDGDLLTPGLALIAPGGVHLSVVKGARGLQARLEESLPVNGHRPSVDVLFESLATVLPASAAAALLTGMGSDGAVGLLALRNAGAWTVAQDESTSVVFGMPREGILRGAACAVLPLPQIGRSLLALE